MTEQITNGGNVATHGTSGDTINGTVTVDGAGSVWTDSGNFFMGTVTGTTPTIAITNGGVVNLAAGGSMQTNDATSRTLITIDGTASRLSMGGTFNMQGKNPADPTAILVTNGGALSTSTINIGRLVGNIARITVDGNGSTWTTASTTNIGLQGSGAVKLTDGAEMTGSFIAVGAQEGSTGTFDVSGRARVTLINASGKLQGLNVGAGGTGTLNANTMAVVTAGSTNIGTPYYTEIGSGLANVDGAGTELNTTMLTVGDREQGTLNITNSGTVNSSGAGMLGNTASLTGNASVIGNGDGTVNVSTHSQWNLINAGGARQTLTVGGSGTGTLNINTTGTVTAGNTTIGSTVTGTGTVSVNGTDAVLNTVALTTGSNGTGTLTITDSGVVDSTGAGVIGGTTGSTGVVDVSSDGQWNLLNAAGAGQTLTVGSGGTGTLNINTTGTVTAGNTNIGNAATGVGTVNVDGEDAVLNTATLTTGVNGEGELTITDSGVVNSTGTGIIGYAAGSAGTVTVDGANSQWNLTSVLTTGAAGTGTMALTNNASVASYGGIVGSTGTGTGTVDVSSGGLWNAGMGALKVGDAGTGILNVNTTGTVAAGNTTIGNAAAGTGTVNVSGVNAVMNTTSLTTGASGQGTLSITDGGVVNTTGAGMGTGITGSAAGSTGTVTVDGVGSQWNLTGSLTTGAAGNLAISTTGSDVLSLSNSGNDYTGDTTVLSGTLRTDVDGALGATATLAINSGAKADLNGTTQSAGRLNTLQNGTLALNDGTLNLAQGGSVQGEITGGGQLNVNGGVLTVEGVNSDMTAGVAVADGATVMLASPDTVLGGVGAGDVTVASGGMLAGQGLVGGNVVNSGTVSLAGSETGNRLTVNGNYTGKAGLLILNTVLNGDNSPTDKLTVHGDTRGNTRVDVNNVGGTGVQTVNGIELVHVDGNSAGDFALENGTVEAGAYVYTLAKGTNATAKNWYLTSKWNGAVPAQEPPVVDPTAPDALRPEAGSYISNIAAANTLFNHRLHDRLGEPQYADALRNGDDSVTSLWMRHVGGHERSSAGDGQLKTQSNRYVLQLGGDIAQWSSDGLDRWHLGVMGGYANEHSNTQSNRVGYGSDGRVSGYSAGLYGTWYQNDADKTGMYVDSWMLYNWFDSSVTADRRERDEYKSKGLTASLEAGYTLKAGEFWGSEGTLNTWYVQPQAQVTWMGVKDDAHRRKDGTRIETQGDGNIQTRLGVRTYLSSHHKMDDGKQRTFQPFVEVNWIHNTETWGVKMDGTTVSRDGARNLGEVRTGVEGKLNDRLSVWGSVGVQMGDKGYSDTQGMLGVKYNW